MNVACYAGTRNVYEDMIPAAKSLLIHSNVDKIYFLIEDDEFPYELPPEIECINVSNQEWFDVDGPNFKSQWTYMVLMKVALTKLFLDLDKILMLDIDTIVNENISHIWNIDLTDYYFAAVKEPHKSSKKFLYTNAGVMLINLSKIREDSIDDDMIYALNHLYFEFKEQDCFNNFCQNYIYELPADYNINYYTTGAKHRKITHFAAIKNWQHLPLVEKYRDAEIERNIPDKYGLDIIIPTYKNKEALETTISSVYDEEIFKLGQLYHFPIRITVVDDCSNLNYDDITEKYPKINLILKEKNEGPGLARQTAIDSTDYPYILFVDTGDYILSKYAILQVILTILSNTTPYIYLWRWLNAEWHTYSDDGSPLLHGVVYKREFLDLFNIKFCSESSYSNEDVGFNRACSLIIKELNLQDSTKKTQFYSTPIYMYTYDKDSITHKNKKEYLYTKQLKGLLLNEYHAIKIGKKNKIHKIFLWEDISHVMVRLWYDFWYLMKYAPETGQEHWELLRKYYNELYKKYQMEDETVQRATIGHYTKDIIKLGVKKINFNQFLKDLENEEYVPELYFDFC